MDSYFQIRDAEHTEWYVSKESRNIADVAAMVTESLRAADESGGISTRAFVKHGGEALRPISAEQFIQQVRTLCDASEETLLTDLDLKDEIFYCSKWTPQKERCVVISGTLSRLMGVCSLAMQSGKLDMDTFAVGVWEHLNMNFNDPQRECQSERWGPRDAPAASRNSLPRRAADLVATYEELLQVPEKACVTCYFGDLGIHVFKYDAEHEQIQTAYEKALAVMEMDSESFQTEGRFVHRGEIISAMRNHLLAGELKPGETVLFVGTEPYGGPGDFDLRGGVVETVNPSERTCSMRGEFFTMHDVPLHYVLGRYDASVEGEHYGFRHVRPLFGEYQELAEQYLREAEASWNAQQTETQTDAPQLMM